MTCLTTSRRAFLQDSLEKQIAQKELVDDAILKNAASGKKSVAMDTGDGRISYSHLTPTELFNLSTLLERQILAKQRKLCGTGVKTITLRRRC